MTTDPIEPLDDVAAVQELQQVCARVTSELSQVIVGQNEVIEQLLIALLARGHCLLVGVPGLAKTLLIRSLADVLKMQFSRIQFTPDLMPSDITGTEVIQEDKTTGTRELRFLPGPIFGNLLLADEINRTPPKTQAALLEAMQEHQVTAGGRRHALPEPFFVLATQNPIEQEGTYPLPEAQLDRFMFLIQVAYPEEADEFEIIKRTTSSLQPELHPVVDAADWLRLSRVVRQIPIADHLLQRALRLVRLTRPDSPDCPADVKQYIRWGAGPRAGQNLALAAKARAALHGRHLVLGEDLKAVMLPVLRHRLVLNFHAEAEGVRADELIQRVWNFLEQTEHENNGRGTLADHFRTRDAR
jgi:MoxR-like ATPase